MNPSPVEILASVLFGLAVLHTFSVKRFSHWAHQHRPGSVKENVLHFLAETEVVFGLWAAALFVGIVAIRGSMQAGVSYIEGLNCTEYALVAGAVVGGGLTVIANAPNPAGIGILQDAKVFGGEGISPLGLFLGALLPTTIAIVFFWILP